MGPFGSDIKTDNFVEQGVPVIRGGNLTSGRFNGDGFVFLTERKADELAKANAFPGDLVFTHRGTLGQVGIIPAAPYSRYVVSQSQMKLTCDTKQALPEYVYYFFKSPQGQAALLANTSQTGVPAISRPITSLKGIRLSLPPTSEQRAIASFLGNLDDRIDLLRQTSATLESIAQALFKSWFIDFGPVRAKADGREPEGIDAATAALFAAEFEKSALGLIPKGWAVRSIEDVAARVGMGPFGSNIKVSTFVDAGVPVLTGACLKGTLLEDAEFRFITAEHAGKLSGALVREGDIVITHRGTLGQVSLIPAGATFETYVLSQSQFFVRANTDATTPAFLTYFLRSPAGQHLLLANVSQVGVPSISRPVSYLKSLQLVVPPVALAKAFSTFATPLHDRIVAGRRQVRLLVELRDSLLPRLLSGKLRLPEAEGQFEEAAA